VDDNVVVNGDYQLLEEGMKEPEEEQDNLENALLQNAPHNEDNDDKVSKKDGSNEIEARMVLILQGQTIFSNEPFQTFHAHNVQPSMQNWR